VVANLMDFSWQAAAFADHVVSGALTSEFAAERQRLEGRIERLRAQHTDVVRDKSAAENKSRRLTERLAAAETEKEDLRRQLALERKDTNRACAEAQAAQAEAKLARAEASLARQRAEEMETRFCGLRDRLDKAEASTRVEVDRTHAQLVDAYRELGARTAPFEASGQ
jgi:chromosome segregation ATPase